MNQRNEPAIQMGTVVSNKQIAAHTFRLKIQSDDFAKMQYIPGFTVDIFLGNPFEVAGCEDRKYSFWNYEPVYNIADFAICTFSKGKGAEWIKELKKGASIFFKAPKGKLLADNSAENYLLIGDVTSLSHLYEINRNLAVSKTIFSFIYAEQEADLFADIDGSFPLHHSIISISTGIDNVVKEIIRHLPEQLDNTIAYNFGHPDICIALHNHLKQERNFHSQNLKTKPFWKFHKEIIDNDC